MYVTCFWCHKTYTACIAWEMIFDSSEDRGKNVTESGKKSVLTREFDVLLHNCRSDGVIRVGGHLDHTGSRVDFPAELSDICLRCSNIICTKDHERSTVKHIQVDIPPKPR